MPAPVAPPPPAPLPGRSAILLRALRRHLPSSCQLPTATSGANARPHLAAAWGDRAGPRDHVTLSAWGRGRATSSRDPAAEEGTPGAILVRGDWRGGLGPVLRALIRSLGRLCGGHSCPSCRESSFLRLNKPLSWLMERMERVQFEKLDGGYTGVLLLLLFTQRIDGAWMPL